MTRSAFTLVALFAAACGDDTSATPFDAAPPDAKRFLQCERAGTSTVTGTGPVGTLDGAHAYARVLGGFCAGILDLTITHDDPMLWPHRPDAALVHVLLTDQLLGTTEWSGTFDVTIESPDESSRTTATLEVERASPAHTTPTFLRATLRSTGIWQLTATVDIPYCDVINCF